MLTEEEVLEKIRQHYKVNPVLFVLMMLLIPAAFVAFIFLPGLKKDLTLTVIIIAIGIIASFIVDYFIIYKKMILPASKMKIDVSSDPVFRVFKTPAELTNALNEAKQAETVYEFNNIKVTQNCIVNFDDPRTLMRFEDVINVYISGDPKNSEGAALFVADNHDRTCHYSMSGDREAAKHVQDLILQRCQNLKDKATKNDSVVEKLN